MLANNKIVRGSILSLCTASLSIAIFFCDGNPNGQFLYSVVGTFLLLVYIAMYDTHRGTLV